MLVRRMTLAPLIHRITHEIQPVYYDRVYKLPKSFFKKPKWHFNWFEIIQSNDQEVYALRLSSDDSIQGFISIQKQFSDKFVKINLVESAPWNVGRHSKQWIAAGQMLFAIGCKISFECDFDGFVYFVSKTKLKSHYEEVLNAKSLAKDSLRMHIDTLSATRLIRMFDFMTEKEIAIWIKRS